MRGYGRPCRATGCSSSRIARRSSIRAATRFGRFSETRPSARSGSAATGPTRFDHVFASIQSLNASGVERIDPDHFDVVIVDEFHHAAAPSYEAVLAHLQPRRTARAHGHARSGPTDWTSSVISTTRSPPSCGSGTPSTSSIWRRSTTSASTMALTCRTSRGGAGSGYDVDALTDVLTADHVWANRVIEQVRQKITDPHAMRALGFCVSVRHARFMAERFQRAGIASVAVWGDSPRDGRQAALRDLAERAGAGRLHRRSLQRGRRRARRLTRC